MATFHKFEIIAAKFEKYRNTSTIRNLPEKLAMFKILLRKLQDGTYWELQLFHNYFEIADENNNAQVLTEICSKLIRVGMDGLYTMKPKLFNNNPAYVDLPEVFDGDFKSSQYFQVYPFGLNNSHRNIAYGSINIPRHLWEPIIDIALLTSQGVPFSYEKTKSLTVIPGQSTSSTKGFVFTTPDSTITNHQRRGHYLYPAQ